ncbi:MAG TPA: ABC transporter substrate-binding protein [Actinomycetota bacterium]|nr:ABC transporter substrate-binding protein [Actinomycetota bacterium]
MRSGVIVAVLTCIALGHGAAPAAQSNTVEVVRFPFPQDDGSLTPYTFEVGYPLMTLVYDTVMWRDADGTPQPWLATSVKADPTHTEITIRLRRGIRWHDGIPLTASDVAFSFDFMSRRHHPRFTPQLSDIEEVKVRDSRTAVITLSRPSAGFFDQPLSDVPILPQHLWDDLPKTASAPPGLPIGSGPYLLDDYQPDQFYRFEANDEYFRGPPAVKAIQVPIINDQAQAFNALSRRRVDMMPVSPPSRYAKELNELSISVKRGPSYLGTALMFNVRRPPFDSRAARRAVSAALDLDRMVDAVNEAVAAETGYLHPESEWASKKPLHKFDLDTAKATLERLDLPTIKILTPNNDPIRTEAGEQVVLALRRAGTEAEIVEVPREELGEAVGEDAPDDFEPTFQAAIWGIPPLISYDPSFILRLFGSDPAEAPINYSGYVGNQFERVATRMETTTDPTLRKRLVIETQKILANEVPAVPLFFSNGAFAFRRSIYDGWVFVKGTGILDKLSFLEGAERPTTPTTPDGSRNEPVSAPESSARGPGLLQLLSLGLVAAVLLVGAFEIVRRLR